MPKIMLDQRKQFKLMLINGSKARIYSYYDINKIGNIVALGYTNESDFFENEGISMIYSADDKNPQKYVLVFLLNETTKEKKFSI